MNARKRWTTTAYRLVVPYREAEQLGIDLGPSEAQQMLLGMYPDARYGVVWLTRHFDMVTYATVFRIHSRVIIPAKVSMQDPLGQRDQEQLQEETREVTINDPSSPTLKITYSQG